MFKYFYNTHFASSNSSNLSKLDLIKLGLLAAIWGGSFIGMRIAVPEIGTLLSATLRIVLAAIALILFTYISQIQLHWQRNFKVYIATGLFGAVLPFALFSYAAQHLPAALSALFNATCPLFGALFSMLWLAERISLRKLIGLILGIGGVWLLAGAGALLNSQPTFLSVIACLISPACFAISGVIVKHHTCTQKLSANRIEPLAMAAGSMLAASLMLLPTLPFSLPAHAPSTMAITLIIALALFPSALAQIIFIPLVARIGPTRAMSVSFLIPLFSILWGVIFLQESIGFSCLLGGFTVLAATGLVIKP
jgi:drug/metabolite transporter (DMT)-like permease